MNDTGTERHRLAGQSLRRRRLADAARLVPFLGLVLLLLLPMLWSGTGGTAGTLVYVFLVWAGLIVLVAALARPLAAAAPRSEAPDEPGGAEP